MSSSSEPPLAWLFAGFSLCIFILSLLLFFEPRTCIRDSHVPVRLTLAFYILPSLLIKEVAPMAMFLSRV